MEEQVPFYKLCHPTYKQLEAFKASDKHKFVLYGGAMGGGKSYWLRWALLRFLLLTYGKTKIKGLKVGLFCEDYPALRDRHIAKIKFEFPDWLGDLRVGDSEFQLTDEFGGGILAFRNLDDVSKYQSAEFAAIGVDEITKNDKEVFDYLRTRLRWPGIVNVRFMCASNPGGVGHNWVKDLWINRKYEIGEKEADQFHFIPARVIDNPHLDQSYLIQLEGLPEALKKAYLDGNWDIFAGQYFSEWSIERHTIPPFEIPTSWKRFRAYDHGREAPACCKWYALDYDGRVWVYREYYQKGKDIDEIALEVNRLSAGENYSYSVADPSIFAKLGFVDRYGGQTIAETFSRHGITFFPASNRRVDGWNLLHQYLRWDVNNPPKIMYFKNCIDSIRTIPSLIHDDKKPEDLNTMGEDHAADCDRYFLASLHEMKLEVPQNDIQRRLEVSKGTSMLNFNEFYYG